MPSRSTPGRVVFGDLGVVGTVFAPEPAGPGSDQHDVAGRQAHALPGERVFQVLSRDPRVARQRVDLLERGDVDQHAPGDDRRNRRCVAFPRPPVAAPVRLLEAVVPVVVGPRRDVGQPVDLGRHVIGDEHRRRMPEDEVRVALGGWCVRVFHPVHAVRAPECDDLARAVTGPLVAPAAVRQPQVEDLAASSPATAPPPETDSKAH